MNIEKFKSKLTEILKADERIWNENKTEMNETKLFDLIDKIDETIIALLLENDETREKFFSKIKDIYVFKTNDFKFFMEEHKINNSYTQYKNRIGLTDGKRFLKNTNDIVLNWPYKDCVLEGGQTTEEGIDTYFEYEEEKTKTVNKKKVTEPAGYKEKQSKRKEIFFNEILAQDEIDRLFDEKAFINWKRYTSKGEEKVKIINRDENNIINENLVINGNNLLALHNLKFKFSGKIKLIYIDPPYNTGGDANIFTYNNTFNHSTWLTFMKNRLDFAKELLRTDGFFAIAIDHYELFYIGAICDEIFGRENRIAIVTVVHNPKGRNQAKFFSENSEFMLVYARNIHAANFNQVAIDDEVLETFTEQDKNGKFRYEKFVRARTVWSKEKRPKNWYPIYVSKDLKNITSEYHKDYYELYPQTSQGDFAWKNIKDTFDELNKGDYFKAEKENDKVILYHKYYEQQVFKNVWTDKKYQSEFQGTNLLKKILGENQFSYPKSLYTVLDTIKIMTSDNDIILDFFAGSGTTGHATFTLNKEDGGNRKFILIEQLNEHIEVCTSRLQKVLSMENINDNDFIYCELAKWNEKAKEEIQNCKSLKDLVKIFDSLYEKYFINYNLRIKEFKEKVIHENEFINLSIEEQKRMFLTMLDLNQMYVHRSEMSDKRFGISKEDQEITEQFYKEI